MIEMTDPQRRNTETMEWRITEPALSLLDFTGRLYAAIAVDDRAKVENRAHHIVHRAAQVAETTGKASRQARPRAVSVVERMTRQHNPDNNLLRYATRIPTALRARP